MGRRRETAGIRRRDFVNGVLMAAGGAALSRFLPGCYEYPKAGPPPEGLCDGAIGADPRALRSANLPSSFDMAHLLRDDRVTFGKDSVSISVSRLSCDAFSGTMLISEDGTDADVIIVGSGISGLAAAFFLRKERPGTKILMLDVNAELGGNAARDDQDPIAYVSSTGGAYAVSPYSDLLTEIYGDCGIDWEAAKIPGPIYNYYFDDQTPHILPNKKGWNIDSYGVGLDAMPYPQEVLDDLHFARQDFLDWAVTDGGPTDPADDSDPKYDDLAQITLDKYFEDQGLHPAVSDFYTRYSIDALAGTAKQVNAFSAISFIVGEYGDLFTYPGGTSGIARHFVKHLIPSAIAGSTTDAILQGPILAGEIDSPKNDVRVRRKAMVLRVDTSASEASAVYMMNGAFFRARAKAIIVAGQSHTAKHIAAHLLDSDAKKAFNQIIQVPVVVANVGLSTAKPLLDLGLGYDEYWWGSKYWADFTISDWMSPDRDKPDRKTVLTFYGGNLADPGDMVTERTKLLQTPFSDYEDSLRADMERILGAGGFDWDQHVTDVFVYRWGHGMIFPTPGMPFGPPTKMGATNIRTDAPRHVLRKQLGRISFAGQDTESTPAIESAIASGRRTASEVLTVL